MLTNRFYINVNVGFLFGLDGHRSPEGQQLHAHRGDQLCQAHPVEDTQRAGQYVLIRVRKYHP